MLVFGEIILKVYSSIISCKKLQILPIFNEVTCLCKKCSLKSEEVGTFISFGLRNKVLVWFVGSKKRVIFSRKEVQIMFQISISLSFLNYFQTTNVNAFLLLLFLFVCLLFVITKMIRLCNFSFSVEMFCTQKKKKTSVIHYFEYNASLYTIYYMSSK